MPFNDLYPVKLTNYLAKTTRAALKVLPKLGELPRIPLIGHRGFGSNKFHGYDPAYCENTLGAFQKGAAAGFSGLEFDIHLTADDELVIHHDPFFIDRKKEKVYIEEESLANLKERFPRTEGICSLKELLNLGLKVDYYCELKKSKRPNRFAEVVLDFYRSEIISRRLYFHFISFELELLAAVKAGLPLAAPSDVMLIARYFRYKDYDAASTAGLDGVHGHHYLFSQDRGNYIRDLGLKIGLGIINHPAHLAIVAGNIDMYFTDNADLLELMPAE